MTLILDGNKIDFFSTLFATVVFQQLLKIQKKITFYKELLKAILFSYIKKMLN